MLPCVAQPQVERAQGRGLRGAPAFIPNEPDVIESDGGGLVNIHIHVVASRHAIARAVSGAAIARVLGASEGNVKKRSDFLNVV